MKWTKKIAVFGIIAFLSMMVLASCSGSDAIQGKWLVQDASGEDGVIIFNDKTVEVDGETFDYTQNAVGTKNGISYHGIQQNGKTYSIIFPAQDKEIALMIVPDGDDYLAGTLIYAMNRSSQPDYYEYSEKYF